MSVQIVEYKTLELAEWVRSIINRYDDKFDAAKIISKRLGGHVEDGYAVLGFWVPELLNDEVNLDTIGIEIYTSLENIDLSLSEQQIKFNRTTVRPKLVGEFLWAVIDGMTPGTRDQVGSFYRGIYQKYDGSVSYFHDVVAYSMPFGMFAPVEFYDIDKFHRNRIDRKYFHDLKGKKRNGVHQFERPSNILEIHIGTASQTGTIAGLDRIYSQIADKIANGDDLQPFEENYIGYDAIQFMPIEPIKEAEHHPIPFSFADELNQNDGERTIRLIRHGITNWGYDINIHGSSAINPTLLESGRPDEIGDLMYTLFSFPGGTIMPIWDLVFGHATNQGLDVLTPEFFTGPNMYGQDMNFHHPIVRAILLEMQRRKTNWGATGLRIDGAQDFKYWDEENQAFYHDDEYLQEISDVVAQAGGVDYYPWMIFEDGRPWPRDDWELASSYRSVIENQPNIWQWGPLTFAHNTPFIYTFWLNKFWRVREIMEFGSHWISGCSNHDTLRRGAQVNPNDKVNSKLGENLRQIIQHAYNNEAQQLFFYLMAPGIPMDFLNANMRSPWMYFRNNDDQYGVKVVAEEHRFLDWWVTPEIYRKSTRFVRLKQWGFDYYEKLYKFMNDLVHLIDITEYNLPQIAKYLTNMHEYLKADIFSEKGLKQFGWDFMDDMYDLVNISQYFDHQDHELNHFNLQIREFRRDNPWLIRDLDLDRGEYFDYLHPSKSRTVYYGRRVSPKDHDNRFELLFIANMEGIPFHFYPIQLPIPNVQSDGWSTLFKPNGMKSSEINDKITLRNSEGIVFIRNL